MNPDKDQPQTTTGDRGRGHYGRYLTYQRYQVPSNWSYIQADPRYNAPAAQARQRSHPLDAKPQTVEDVITQGYLAMPPSFPETALLTDRAHTAWLGLDDTVHQIRHRLKIYERNVYDIERGKCDLLTQLHQWQNHAGHYANYKLEVKLREGLRDLYADQRAERVSAWRDIARLRQTFPEVAQTYLSAQRKIDILNTSGGDAL